MDGSIQENEELPLELAQTKLTLLKEKIQKISKKNDKAISTSVIEIDQLIVKLKNPGKKSIKSMVKDSKIFDKIYTKFSSQVEDEEGLSKHIAYSKSIEQLGERFLDLKEIIYLGQGAEHIDDFILSTLMAINNSMPTLLLNHQDLLINDSISCLINLLDIKKNLRFKECLNTSNSFRLCMEEFAQLANAITTDEPIQALNKYRIPLFLVGMILTGELKSVYTLPLNNIKKAFKALIKLTPSADTESEIDDLVREIEINTKLLAKFKDYLKDSCEIIDQVDRDNIIAKICIVLAETNLLPASKDNAGEMQALQKKVDPIIFGDEISNIEKLTADLTEEILAKHKSKILQMLKKIPKTKTVLNDPHDTLKWLKKTIVNLQSIKKQYDDHNDNCIKDEEFLILYTTCFDHYTSLIECIKLFIPYYKVHKMSDVFLKTINDRKLPELTIKDDNIFISGMECNLSELVLHISERKNWIYKTP